MSSASRLGDITHRRAIAVASVIAGVLASMVARRTPVPYRELRLTVWFNDAPDWVAQVIYPIMQAGSLAGPLVAGAVIAVWKRDYVLAIATSVAGLATWFAAKGIKNIVHRQRPAAYLPNIHVRDGSGQGLGFISGHAAVAATVAVCMLPVIPRGYRWVAALVVAVVGVARIVHGVHLPADVVGGWSFGTLVGLAALWCADRVDLALAASHSNRKAS